MSVDFSKLRIGDSVRLRDGCVEIVEEIESLEDSGFYKWHTNFGYYYSNDGRTFPNIEGPSDIVKIIPKENGNVTDFIEFIEYLRDTVIGPLNDQAATLRKVSNELRVIGGMEEDATKYTTMANTYDHAAETVRAAILAWGENE